MKTVLLSPQPPTLLLLLLLLLLVLLVVLSPPQWCQHPVGGRQAGKTGTTLLLLLPHSMVECF
jgi:hypothetical protein